MKYYYYTPLANQTKKSKRKQTASFSALHFQAHADNELKVNSLAFASRVVTGEVSPSQPLGAPPLI